MKYISRFFILLLVMTLFASGASAATLQGGANGAEFTNEATVVGTYAQAEEALVARLLDNDYETWYEFTGWTSKASDDIPEIGFRFYNATISDVWVRNGKQRSWTDYDNNARPRRIRVRIITDTEDVEYTYAMEDKYDMTTVNNDWYLGYQHLSLPRTFYGVNTVEFWINGWFRGDTELYNVCLSDVKFTCGTQAQPVITEEPRWITTPTPTATEAPWWITTPTPTAVPWWITTPTPTEEPWYPVNTPVPAGKGNVKLKDRMATRSGPSTLYTETGSYFSAGSWVTPVSAAWDKDNCVWWIQVEFMYGNELRRAYTGLKRLDMGLDNLRIENGPGQDTSILYDTAALWGPGNAYAVWDSVLPAGTDGKVISHENGYVQFEYYAREMGQWQRVWVPSWVTDVADEDGNG